MLGVPLLREGLPIGVLVLLRAMHVRPFTDKQIELVTTFADQAVIAIENVRLFDEVQARTRELSEALEQQTATSEVLRSSSSSPGELEPVFQAMLENAVRHLRGQVRHAASRYEGEVFRAWRRCTARRPRMPNFKRGADRSRPATGHACSTASCGRSRWSTSPTSRPSRIPSAMPQSPRSAGARASARASRCSRMTS